MKNLALAALGAIAFFTAASPAAARPVIVELFTSQGCSSCPPADAYLRDLVKRDDVLPLAFHVDYWDDLGWKDTLDNPAFTERQRGYAAAMGRSRVYTPQMVVDGRTEGVGSDRSGMGAQIAEAAIANSVDIHLAKQNLLSVAGGPGDTKATLWLVRYRKSTAVTISRGENRGETITYVNAVSTMKPLAEWRGQPIDVPLAAADIPAAEDDGVAVILQTDGQGPILGALRLADRTGG